MNTNLDLYLIENGSHPLMGCDWLSALGIEISFKLNNLLGPGEANLSVDEIFIQSRVKIIIQDFPEVFPYQIREYKGEPVQLRLKDNAKPK